MAIAGAVEEGLEVSGTFQIPLRILAWVSEEDREEGVSLTSSITIPSSTTPFSRGRLGALSVARDCLAGLKDSLATIFFRISHLLVLALLLLGTLKIDHVVLLKFTSRTLL
jgi:hypothetical protein